MSKTLTEKWKDGELIFGKTYWCSDDEGNVTELVLVSNNRFYERALGIEVIKDVKEVLAPVPSYEELREKEVIYNTTSRCNETLLWENESLKNKVGKLKEQLKEANEVINNMKLCMNDKYDYDCVAEDVDVYREKWGVK